MINREYNKKVQI